MKDTTVTVLLVDDDKVDTMAVRRSFLALNIANPVIEARNGIEALDRLRGLNGYEKVPRPCLRDARFEHAAHGRDRISRGTAKRSRAAPHSGLRDDDLRGGGGSDAGL